LYLYKYKTRILLKPALYRKGNQIMEKRIGRVLLALVSIAFLAGCGADEKDDVQNVMNSAAGYGTFADVGKGTVVMELEGAALADTFSASDISLSVGFQNMSVKSVKKISSTSFSLSMEGKCNLDGTANMGLVRLNYTGTTQTENNYICSFPIVSDLIYVTKSTTSRSGVVGALVTTTHSNLGLWNGAKWVESAITADNITYTTTDETNYPLAKLESDFSYDSTSEEVIVNYNNASNDAAGYKINFAAATNDFAYADSLALTKI
jgi:hypothetical protein